MRPWEVRAQRLGTRALLVAVALLVVTLLIAVTVQFEGAASKCQQDGGVYVKAADGWGDGYACVDRKEGVPQ